MDKTPTSHHLFHPYEIAFCGYSNSGKTTLITKLIEKMSSNYSIGYVKHDAHAFVMDHEGKDTDRAWKSGASTVYITDPKHSALLTTEPAGNVHQKTQLLQCDLIFVEGYKNAPISKIVVIDEKHEILDKDLSNVVAFVGQQKSMQDLPRDLPYFHQNDLNGIKAFVEQHLQNIVQQTPLYGLVLAGGYSKRMQQDKALLNYHGKPQAEVCYELLSRFCQKTYISARKEQWQEGQLTHLPIIHDRLLDFGPLGAILTSMISHPQAAWLVVACDLPFLDEKTLKKLIERRNPFKIATAFQSIEDQLPEPLCAIYEPKVQQQLFQFLGLGCKCPRKILIRSRIESLSLGNSNTLENVNEKDHFEKIAQVKGRG